VLTDYVTCGGARTGPPARPSKLRKPQRYGRRVPVLAGQPVEPVTGTAVAVCQPVGDRAADR
jgi:hypothetical protein